MTIERKVGMGIAGQPTGGATDVAEVFSTYLYDGTAPAGGSGSNTITNGIDLAGEGGMVWVKVRDAADDHVIWDTERGAFNGLRTNQVDGTYNISPDGLTSFNSDGFSLEGGITNWNNSSKDYVSWTFRKKEKFFDIVTYTGDNTTGRSISHALDGPVGLIIVKKTNGTGNWHVLHRSVSLSGSPAEGALRLNTDGFANSYSSNFNATFPTDSVFYVSHLAGASSSTLNTTGETYVAYVFADNSAEDADDQMIKCGYYFGNSSTLQDINLGWEPQFLILKNASATGGWFLWDKMRGFLGGANNGDGHPLYSNAASAEFNNDDAGLLSNGFQVADALNTNSNLYIYMAIRAPMMIEPEAATDVFAPVVGRSSNSGGKGNFLSGFPVDLGIATSAASGGTRFVASRLTGKEYLQTSSNAAGANNAAMLFDYSDGWGESGFGSYNSWMWKRAKGFFDVVAYTGDGQQGKTVAHSLGVVPEMMWVKLRDQQAYSWAVYSKDLSINQYLVLDTTAAPATNSLIWDGTQPTDSVFSTGDTGYWNNGNTKSYIAYLFATLAGVSKVGSYTGNGSNQTIDCGFSAGARFILIKRTDAVGDWYVWDSVRGIVAGNDPHLSLHTTASQVTNDDSVDPHNSGFIVNQVSATNINVSSGTYIFYAIA